MPASQNCSGDSQSRIDFPGYTLWGLRGLYHSNHPSLRRRSHAPACQIPVTSTILRRENEDPGVLSPRGNVAEPIVEQNANTGVFLLGDFLRVSKNREMYDLRAIGHPYCPILSRVPRRDFTS
jgi:hypothetical protein